MTFLVLRLIITFSRLPRFLAMLSRVLILDNSIALVFSFLTNLKSISSPMLFSVKFMKCGESLIWWTYYGIACSEHKDLPPLMMLVVKWIIWLLCHISVWPNGWSRVHATYVNSESCMDVSLLKLIILGVLALKRFVPRVKYEFLQKQWYQGVAPTQALKSLGA